MGISVRDAKNRANVDIQEGEIIDIKGAIFKVISAEDGKIECAPLSIDEIKDIQKTSLAHVKAPGLKG